MGEPVRDRLVWPDLAKGVCVVLVVLWHVSSKSFSVLPGTDAWTGLWSTVSAVLTPFRIPLFFTVSGFFAARSLDRPLRGVLRPRVLQPYYLYSLWLGVHTVVFSFLELRTNTARDPVELVLYLLTGASNLWYLYALAVYFLLARGLRRWAVPSVVAAASVCVVAYAGLLPAWGNSEGLLRNLFFFLLGAYVPGLVRRLAASASWTLLGAATALFLVCAALRLALGPWAAVPAALTGVALAVTAASLAGGWVSVRWLAVVGRRTLPVYVLHLPLLALVHAGALRADLDGLGPVLVLYPPVVTALLVLACLGLHRALRRAGAGVLFTLPAGWTSRSAASTGTAAAAPSSPAAAPRPPA